MRWLRGGLRTGERTLLLHQVSDGGAGYNVGTGVAPRPLHVNPIRKWFLRGCPQMSSSRFDTATRDVVTMCFEPERHAFLDQLLARAAVPFDVRAHHFCASFGAQARRPSRLVHDRRFTAQRNDREVHTVFAEPSANPSIVAPRPLLSLRSCLRAQPTRCTRQRRATSLPNTRPHLSPECTPRTDLFPPESRLPALELHVSPANVERLSCRTHRTSELCDSYSLAPFDTEQDPLTGHAESNLQ